MKQTIENINTKIATLCSPDKGLTGAYDIALSSYELLQRIRSGRYKNEAGASPEILETILEALSTICKATMYLHDIENKTLPLPLWRFSFCKAASIVLPGYLSNELLIRHANSYLSKTTETLLPSIQLNIREEKSACWSIDALLSDMGRMLITMPSTFRTSGLAAYILPPFYKAQYTLVKLFGELEPSIKAAKMDPKNTPNFGPDTPEEMLFILCMAEARMQLTSPNGHILQSKTYQALQTLKHLIYPLCDDIDMMRHWEENYDSLMYTSAAFCIGISESIGFSRYFVQTHKDKLHGDKWRILNLATIDLYHSHHSDYMDTIERQLGSEEANSLSPQWAKIQDWHSYSQPSPEDLAQEFANKKWAKNPKTAADRIQKYENLRRKRPLSMEEVVTRYVPQDKILKSERDQIHRNHTKSMFLKHVARHHISELRSIGLPNEAIIQMRETGSIPYNPEGYQYNLSVEHIVDRGMGGTNHMDNMILMPPDVNGNKNDFIQVQTGPEKKAEGQWIISWQPKRLQDGTYPKVLILENPIDVNLAQRGTPCTEFAPSLNNKIHPSGMKPS